MKKILMITLTLFPIMFLAGNLEKKTLTFNLQEGDPPTLHPHKGIDLRSRCLFLALYEPLMRRNSDGTLETAAAEKIEISQDLKTYTFHIRPHKWSNGQPVTSHHFSKAWKYALDPSSCCVRSDLFYPIKNALQVKQGELPLELLKISTPDEKTLIVELDHPTPYFLDLVASPFFSPLYLAEDSEPSCFNGPFIIGEWIHEKKLVFKQNPFYWDKDSAQLDEIHFTMVKEPTAALAMYEKGNLDLIGDPFSPLPLDAIPNLMHSGNLKTKPISRIFYLLLNTNCYPLNVKSFRKALALSIDRESLTEHLFYGERPTKTHLPVTLSQLNEQKLKDYNNANELFNKALKELQLTREKFPKIILNYANASGQKRLAEFIQEQWREKLGIKVEIECSEWNVHSANLAKKNYQIGTIHLTTLYQDPMFYLDLFKDKDAFCNYSGWENSNYRSILEKSQIEKDQKNRYALLQQAEMLLYEEMPVIPIFTQTLQYLVKDNIKLVVSDLGIYDFKKTKILETNTIYQR